MTERTAQLTAASAKGGRRTRLDRARGKRRVSQRNSANVRSRPLPARPALTPALVVGCALWAACAATLAFGRTHAHPGLVGVAVAAFFASCITALLRHERMPAIALCLAIGLAGGAVLGGIQAMDLTRLASIAGSETYVACSATLVDDPQASSYGTVAHARVKTPGKPERLMKVRFAKGFTDADEVRFGDTLAFQATPEPIDYAAYPSDWRRGIAATVTVRAASVGRPCGVRGTILSLRNRAISAFGGDKTEEGALLEALICGYREDIDSCDVYRAFRICGLAHLVAVSGAHLVIVTSLVSSLLRAARLPRFAIIAIIGCAIGAYLLIAGMPISAVRAAVMSLLGSCSYFAQRRSSSVNALGAAIIGIVLFDPQASLSLSFSLSALSTLGIILFSGYFCCWLGQGGHAAPAAITEPLALTAAASLMSVPLSSALFSQLPVVSPLANVITAPLFPIVCSFGLMAGVLSLVGGPAFTLAFVCASASAKALCFVVSALARIPYASIPISVSVLLSLVLTGACAAALYLAWPKPSLPGAGVCTAIAFAFAIAIAIRPASSPEIVMLDVGQGDAFLVRSDRSCMLIDTGNQDGMLLTALARAHVRKLDAVLITHADDDHCGSLDALQGTVVVDRVIVASDMLSCEDGACKKLAEQAHATAPEVVGVTVGDRIDVGCIRGRVIWPYAFSNSGGNEDSLCVAFDADVNRDGVVDETALFTGDIDAASLKTALERSGIAGVDVLKVGHHGSNTSTDEALAETLHPRVSLISVGARNRYGHPKREVIEALEGAGSTIVRTDQSGDVSCELELGSVRVRTQR